jgi:hypothetical protein
VSSVCGSRGGLACNHASSPHVLHRLRYGRDNRAAGGSIPEVQTGGCSHWADGDVNSVASKRGSINHSPRRKSRPCSGFARVCRWRGSLSGIQWVVRTIISAGTWSPERLSGRGSWTKILHSRIPNLCNSLSCRVKRDSPPTRLWHSGISQHRITAGIVISRLSRRADWCQVRQRCIS